MDFNVPIKDGRVSDTTRIDEALPTLESLFKRGAKKIILMSHLGRPDGKPNAKYSLKPLVPVLQQKLKYNTTTTTYNNTSTQQHTTHFIHSSQQPHTHDRTRCHYDSF